MIDVRPFSAVGTPQSIPEIIHVAYDLWSLQITLSFHEQKQPVYVRFPAVGFRVLDEGDLLEFWGDEVRIPGWIWQINAGGWFDQESARSGFTMGQLGHRPLEYLIIGDNDCVSVLSWEEPQILLA